MERHDRGTNASASGCVERLAVCEAAWRQPRQRQHRRGPRRTRRTRALPPRTAARCASPFDLAVGRAVYGYQGTLDSGDLAAFDAASGAVRWHGTVPRGRLGTGEGLVVSAGEHITAVADVDGAHRWSAPLDYSDARFVFAAI